jgi:hypothetical protein
MADSTGSGDLDPDDGAPGRRVESEKRKHDLSWSLFEALLHADLWPPQGVERETQKGRRRVRHRRR